MDCFLVSNFLNYVYYVYVLINFDLEGYDCELKKKLTKETG